MLEAPLDTLAFPSPQHRLPITLPLFLQLCLPAWICYYLSAVLVLLPGTFYARLALLPITLYYAFRCATTLDVVAGYEEERLAYFNQGLTVRTHSRFFYL